METCVVAGGREVEIEMEWVGCFAWLFCWGPGIWNGLDGWIGAWVHGCMDGGMGAWVGGGVIRTTNCERKGVGRGCVMDAG